MLKIHFSNNTVIFFCLDAVYYTNNILVLLINILNLSIKKQISDKATILAYFKYSLGCPWFCLTEARKAKVVKGNLVTDFIKVIFTEGAIIGGIFTRIDFVGDIYIDTKLFSTSF